MTVTVAPPATEVAVRKASRYDTLVLSRVLADAFYDDPAGRWFFPRAHTRRRQLERFFSLVMLERTALEHDEVWTTDGVAGAAIWMPPGSMQTTALDEARLMPALLRAGGRDIVRALRGMGAMEAVHPTEPHWYLPQIGVATAWQGRGIGSALLRPVLDRCDDEGMPAYLEATSEQNRALYERNGFEAFDVLSLPSGGPVLTLMWREPQA
jgi:GNAT superfamily N-acetyltransferase